MERLDPQQATGTHGNPILWRPAEGGRAGAAPKTENGANGRRVRVMTRGRFLALPSGDGCQRSRDDAVNMNIIMNIHLVNMGMYESVRCTSVMILRR